MERGTLSKFSPTNVELVEEFLMKKISGLPIPPKTAEEHNSHFLDPESIDWSPVAEYKDNERYVFIRRVPKSTSGLKVQRSGNDQRGFWRASQVNREIKNQGQVVIGLMNHLNFMAYDLQTLTPRKTRWIMHELIPFDSTNHFQEWSVCRVKNTGRQIRRTAPPPSDDAQSDHDHSPPSDRDHSPVSDRDHSPSSDHGHSPPSDDVRPDRDHSPPSDRDHSPPSDDAQPDRDHSPPSDDDRPPPPPQLFDDENPSPFDDENPSPFNDYRPSPPFDYDMIPEESVLPQPLALDDISSRISLDLSDHFSDISDFLDSLSRKRPRLSS